MIHCTATVEGKSLTGADIKKMHTSPKPAGRGWKVVGYADLFHLNGGIENLVPYNQDDVIQPHEITNGAVGMNSKTRHVSYVGGVDKFNKPKDTRNDLQKAALKTYVLDFLKRYPSAQVLGHNQVAPKACPSFDVPTWLKSIGVAEKNIFKK